MTATTLTLTDFLLARIAEDETVAQQAAIEQAPEEEPIFTCGRALWGDHVGMSPARVLAECEAKRRIVELHPEMLEWCQTCGHEMHPCRTLLTLAAVYADHPDYRDEWRV